MALGENRGAITVPGATNSTIGISALLAQMAAERLRLRGGQVTNPEVAKQIAAINEEIAEQVSSSSSSAYSSNPDLQSLGERETLPDETNESLAKNQGWLDWLYEKTVTKAASVVGVERPSEKQKKDRNNELFTQMEQARKAQSKKRTADRETVVENIAGLYNEPKSFKLPQTPDNSTTNTTAMTTTKREDAVVPFDSCVPPDDQAVSIQSFKLTATSLPVQITAEEFQVCAQDYVKDLADVVIKFTGLTGNAQVWGSELGKNKVSWLELLTNKKIILDMGDNCANVKNLVASVSYKHIPQGVEKAPSPYSCVNQNYFIGTGNLFDGDDCYSPDNKYDKDQGNYYLCINNYLFNPDKFSFWKDFFTAFDQAARDSGDKRSGEVSVMFPINEDNFLSVFHKGEDFGRQPEFNQTLFVTTPPDSVDGVEDGASVGSFVTKDPHQDGAYKKITEIPCPLIEKSDPQIFFKVTVRNWMTRLTHRNILDDAVKFAVTCCSRSDSPREYVFGLSPSQNDDTGLIFGIVMGSLAVACALAILWAWKREEKSEERTKLVSKVEEKKCCFSC